MKETKDYLPLVAKLTLEEKVNLLTGRDMWYVNGNEKVSLNPMLFSDGPSGVRGDTWDARDASLNLPSSGALASTWNVEMAKKYGTTLAAEAKRKGANVVLGPTINLHRSPYGGRHFECLSEDPFLTGTIAKNYIASLQSKGVAACPKHYVANDFETDRFTVNVKVDEKTLREVYLRPFEDAVTEGGAWSIMSAYNQVNGATMTENNLLQTPLKDEWAFSGAVISDWTAVRSLNSAKYPQDIVMPGPMGPWGEALVAAVKSGEIAESIVDDKVARFLQLADRTGALNTPAANPPKGVPSAEGVAFAREVATEGAVLLKNENVLPLNVDAVKSVALIGHNASLARTQGGGSATVIPLSVVSPLQALKAEFGDRVSYQIGAVVQEGIEELPRETLRNPKTGKPGVQVDMYGKDGSIIFADEMISTSLMWLGSGAPIPLVERIVMKTEFTPQVTEERLFGFANARHIHLKLDGATHIEGKAAVHSEDPFISLMDPPVVTKKHNFVAGKTVLVEFDIDMTNRVGIDGFAYGINFGFQVDKSGAEAKLAAAVESAKNSEIAIVVVGTNAQVESEGYDRKSLRLPGDQDKLVEAVAAVNKNTVVVVNSGSPVLLPWADKVQAILVTYFAGQEMGNALVDMLSGRREPGGRLPTTWASSEESLPVSDVTPQNGAVEYKEGIHIGYRAWQKAGAIPAFWFGSGMGYTTWDVSAQAGGISVKAGSNFEVKASVKNTGTRKGKQVVQIYASAKGSKVDRPKSWLVGFASVELHAGESKELSIPIAGKEFRHWESGWKYEAGNFELHVGTSVVDIHGRVDLNLA